MRRITEFPEVEAPDEPPPPKPPRWVGPLIEPEDSPTALALLDEVQEFLIFLMTPEVKRAVPIPVWNELGRLDTRIDRLLTISPSKGH